MSVFRAKLAFGWDVIVLIPRHPRLVPMLAKLAAARGYIAVGCWWTGIRVDDLRGEAQRRQRLQILIGGDRS
jgi:hypothetical protein